MTTDQNTDITVILNTAIFEDVETVESAIQCLQLPQAQQLKLEPENMNDKDWDNVLSLVLSANRVITL